MKRCSMSLLKKLESKNYNDLSFHTGQNVWVCVCVCMLVCVSHSVVSDSLLPHWQISRQEYWRGLPFPSPGDFPDTGTNLGRPLLADSLPSEPPRKPILLRMAIIKNSTYNKRWRWHREKRAFLNCWWEWKLVQSLRKTVWRLLEKN